MLDLFDSLTHAVAGQFGLAVLASFFWGILSIVLSPCHLTSIPLVIAYISKQNEVSSGKNYLLAVFFSMGILTSIGLIGFITAAMGRLMGDVGVWGIWLTAFLLISFGLYLMDIIGLDWLGGRLPSFGQTGLLGAILLGLVFGIGLGPCTFAFLAPVLTVVIPLAQTAFLKAMLLILAFGVGHSLVYVAGAGLADGLRCYIDWSEDQRAPTYIKRFLGFLMLLGGIYFGYTAF